MPETYTGTEGTAAAADGMSVLDGNEDRRTGWLAINKTRDYIVAKIAALWPLTIARGGTGANNATAALTALGGVASSLLAPGNAAQANKIPTYNAGAQLTTADPTLGGHAASKQYVDTVAAGGMLSDGPTSAAYSRGATGSGFVTVWMNSSLQWMRNTSSRRYKENIRDWAGSVIGLRTVVFDRIEGDPDEVGFIAEEVLETLPEAVVYWEGEVDGISDRVLLTAAIATIQQQHLDMELLAQRLEALEAEGD